MEIRFEIPLESDAEAIIGVQNKAFYSDYMKYGLCPAYGRTPEQIIDAMRRSCTYKIVADGRITGKVSAHRMEEGSMHLDCLCVIPEYENRGIGRMAVAHIEGCFPGVKSWTLETPADSQRNRRFYEK
jgi:ribosomal protein S18 acetylase RimI-like enzyme